MLDETTAGPARRTRPNWPRGDRPLEAWTAWVIFISYRLIESLLYGDREPFLREGVDAVGVVDVNEAAQDRIVGHAGDIAPPNTRRWNAPARVVGARHEDATLPLHRAAWTYRWNGTSATSRSSSSAGQGRRALVALERTRAGRAVLDILSPEGPAAASCSSTRPHVPPTRIWRGLVYVRPIALEASSTHVGRSAENIALPFSILGPRHRTHQCLAASRRVDAAGRDAADRHPCGTEVGACRREPAEGDDRARGRGRRCTGCSLRPDARHRHRHEAQTYRVCGTSPPKGAGRRSTCPTTRSSSRATGRYPDIFGGRVVAANRGSGAPMTALLRAADDLQADAPTAGGGCCGGHGC